MSVAGILNRLKNIKHANKIYLVGGIVRDILLRRDTKDVDLVCKGAESLARKFAKSTGGSFFVLDQENKVYRVVLKPATYFDFAELRGGAIEADLALRDFTIDAMALELVGGRQSAVNSKNIIDPFKGQEDLNKKISTTKQKLLQKPKILL